MKFFYHLVSKLPIKVLYVFSDFFYVFISRFYRKKVVETNIKNSFLIFQRNSIRKLRKGFIKIFVIFSLRQSNLIQSKKGIY